MQRNDDGPGTIAVEHALFGLVPGLWVAARPQDGVALVEAERDERVTA